MDKWIKLFYSLAIKVAAAKAHLDNENYARARAELDIAACIVEGAAKESDGQSTASETKELIQE